jgi:hypothetical protein
LSTFRFETFLDDPTFSGAEPEREFRLNGTPFEFDNVVVADAELPFPRMNCPPVAAVAVPVMATNRAR